MESHSMEFVLSPSHDQIRPDIWPKKISTQFCNTMSESQVETTYHDSSLHSKRKSKGQKSAWLKVNSIFCIFISPWANAQIRFYAQKHQVHTDSSDPNRLITSDALITQNHLHD